MTSLQASNLGPVYGQQVTLTATVRPVAGLSGMPAGTVTFLDGSAVVGTAQLSNGTASLTISDLPAASDPITASYNGNSQFGGSGSRAVDVNVQKDGTSVDISSSASTIDVGQSITFTALVAPDAPGSGTPTGTVTFRDGQNTLGTEPLNGGTAVFTTDALMSGPHEISAVYGGDRDFLSNTSSSLGEMVSAAEYDTVTHVKVKSRSVSYGKSATFSVSVQSTSAFSGAPTGTVLLIYEGDVYGNLQLQSGKATFTVSSLPAGHDSVYVYYVGDPTFSDSTSNTIAETIAQERTKTKVASSRDPSSAGQAITLTVRVSPAGNGRAIPTGSVTFLDGPKFLGMAELSGGNASLNTSLLSAGTHRIRVRYNGSTDFAASSSPILRQKIKQSAPTALRLSQWPGA
jgi:hypothetical protein